MDPYVHLYYQRQNNLRSLPITAARFLQNKYQDHNALDTHTGIFS